MGAAGLSSQRASLTHLETQQRSVGVGVGWKSGPGRPEMADCPFSEPE